MLRWLPQNEKETHVDIWKRFGEKEVSHSMAHYLQAIAALKTDKGHARVVDIADSLGPNSGRQTRYRPCRHRT